MIKKLSLVMIISIMMTGCDNNTADELEFGTYSGSFTVFYDYNTSEQTSHSGSTVLTLDEGGYNLTEETYVTPPRSIGNCEWTAATISFQDTTIHTAEFDWQLIIHGSYVYSYDGLTLDMSQLDSDAKRKYRYILTKD